MGSSHGLSPVHNAPEPCGLALDHAPALTLSSGIKSKSKIRSKRRFMGSDHGFSAAHNAHEPGLPLTRPVGHPFPSPLNRSGDRGLGRGGCVWRG
jgi:hypothetical protein